MLSRELRRRYIDFFVKKHGHKEILGASLIPENDPTVLFTTAGMHPLVPYLMGEPHPEGKRLVNAQKCVRTDDIEKVGDETHLTFFEMLGNWSLGDYFKEEAIRMSYEFLTSLEREGGLGLHKEHLCISCFAGDKDAPQDLEATKAWEKLGFHIAKPGESIEGGLIYFYGKKENWWGPAGFTGPCGPDTEMFYDTGKPKCELCDAKGPACECDKYVEVWNDVFMQYFKNADGTYSPLQQKNVDTGLGFERVCAILQGKKSFFETELFEPAVAKIRDIAERAPQNKEEKISERIIADHLRAATFILGDDFGVTPSNTDQGYVLRRLIRRAIRHGKTLGIYKNFAHEIAEIYVRIYKDIFPELGKNHEKIVRELQSEEEKFRKTLERGLKYFEQLFSDIDPALSREQGKSVYVRRKNIKPVTGNQAFELFATYGFPLEMTIEEARNCEVILDPQCKEQFGEAFKKHQELSRAGAEQKFAGGLADHSEECKMHHTATHLLHHALREVLGAHVFQKGSNITKERLRFDFSHSTKLTPEQIKEIERIVNEQIKLDLPVHYEVIDVAEAKKRGAIGLFEDKYAQLGNRVKVYFMGDYSREVCGGPHVGRTGVLKGFKILKEESVAAGVRRIKAVVEGLKDIQKK